MTVLKLSIGIFAATIFQLSFGFQYEKKTINFDGLDLRSPMDIPLVLAGNFCEMRSNHWHTGLDIKTLGAEGYNLRAIADGYISRIKISPWGYGLAIYVNHPNGLTSVFAHISKFPPKIDSLVYEKQRTNESWYLDEDVLKDSLFVKKGELIAYSGNSGSSTAPHLHFEIRETKTEHAINPLKFRCYRNLIQDQTPPTLSGLKVYAVDKNGYMIPGKSKYYSCQNSKAGIVVNGNKPIDVSDLLTETSYLAFGFHTTDKLDAAHNVCGVHHTTFYQNEILRHEQIMDYMIFDVSRFINAHKDYFEFRHKRRNIHKQWVSLINPLPSYPTANGLISWENAAGNYRFTAIDVHGNKRTLNFKLTMPKGEKAKNPFTETSNKYYFPDSVNTYLTPNFQVLMQPSTFYEPMEKIFRVNANNGTLTPRYVFGEYATPVQEYFDLRLKIPDSLAHLPSEKIGIGLYSNSGWLKFLGGTHQKGWIEGEARNFGEFVLVIDTVPPNIRPYDYSNSRRITKYNTLELNITDNLSDVKQCKAYINNEWVLMNYSRRKKRYIIPLDNRSKKHLRKGTNEIKIWAQDQKDNESKSVVNVIY